MVVLCLWLCYHLLEQRSNGTAGMALVAHLTDTCAPAAWIIQQKLFGASYLTLHLQRETLLAPVPAPQYPGSAGGPGQSL